MKSIAQWFIKQTTPMKISVSFITVAVIITALISLVNFVSNITNPTDTVKPVVVPTETAKPTVTPTPTKTPATPANTDPEVPDSAPVGDLFPYGETSYYDAQTLAKLAAVEQCKIVQDETYDSIIARYLPYMPDAASFVKKGYEMSYGTTMERSCQIISVNNNGYYADTDTFIITVKTTSFNIDISERNKPAAERNIVRNYLEYTYTLQHQTNGSWTIKGIGI